MAGSRFLRPRILPRSRAASYCGHDSLEEFDRWARRVGLMPVPGRNGAFYDVRQMDYAIDLLMGINDTSGARAAEQSAAGEYFSSRAR